MGKEALVSAAGEARRGLRTLKLGLLFGLNEKMADEFKKIAKETVSKAQDIRCPPQDYVKGLRLIIEMLQKELMGKGEGG